MYTELQILRGGRTRECIFPPFRGGALRPSTFGIRHGVANCAPDPGAARRRAVAWVGGRSAPKTAILLCIADGAFLAPRRASGIFYIASRGFRGWCAGPVPFMRALWAPVGSETPEFAATALQIPVGTFLVRSAHPPPTGGQPVHTGCAFGQAPGWPDNQVCLCGGGCAPDGQMAARLAARPEPCVMRGWLVGTHSRIRDSPRGGQKIQRQLC